MVKVTYVENGKPIVGLGIEYSDWEALKNGKKTFCFEIGGQQVHVGYIESKEKLAEKIQKNGLASKIVATPEPIRKDETNGEQIAESGERQAPETD